MQWNVSDVKVAIVTFSGWVMTRHTGLVVITATCEGTSASVSVDVVDRALAESSVSLSLKLPGPRPARPAHGASNRRQNV